MKEKILAALKTKFQGVQDAILDRVATKLAKTVKDEDKIDDAINGVDFQQVLDIYTESRVNETHKTAVTNYEKKHNLKDGKPVQVQTTDTTIQTVDENTPEWAKAIIKQNQELTQKVAGLESGNKQELYKARILAIMKEKKIPDKMLNGRVINDESEIDTVVTEIETTYNELKQDFVNANLGNETPGSGNIGTGGNVEKSIADWAKSRQVETKK